MDTRLISALRDMTFFDLLYAVFLLMGTLAPGFLILYLYQPDAVHRLDTVKLCIFCFALTAPLVLLNTLLAGLADPALTHLKDDPAAEKPLRQTLAYSGLISLAVLYAAIAVAYLTGASFKAFLAWTAAAEALLIAAAAIRKTRRKTNAGARKPPTIDD